MPSWHSLQIFSPLFKVSLSKFFRKKARLCNFLGMRWWKVSSVKRPQHRHSPDLILEDFMLLTSQT